MKNIAEHDFRVELEYSNKELNRQQKSFDSLIHLKALLQAMLAVKRN
jgi:hypothetical protein